MMKRKLSTNEIEDILDFIKPYPNIPEETGKSIVEIVKNKLRKQLKTQELYPEVIPELKTQLIKNYFDCQIHPGESVGILCAQSIGEKNTQQSISPMERVLIRHNSMIKSYEIGEFIDSRLNEDDEYEKDNYMKIIEERYDILTISQDEKIEWKKINQISKHPTNGNLIKIKTMSGREVTTTLSHSHLKRCKGGVSPVLGSELKIGDRVPVMKYVPSIETKCDDRNMVMSWFLGVYFAFGSVSDKYVLIKNTNKYTKELFNFTIDLLTLEYDKRDDFYYIECKEIIGMVRELFGEEIYDKKVPNIIYNMSSNEKKLFLKAFMEENGTISKSIKSVECIQMLLCNFNIHSRVIRKKIYDMNFYMLTIQNKYKTLFSETFPTIQLDRSIFENDYDKDEDESSDVVWDEIIDIIIIDEDDYEGKYVYDFSVKDNETFGLLSGIVVHNTLNTFHKCGQNEKSVTTGVPRFQELLNATKNPKIVNCKIYMKENNLSLGELRNTIGHNFVALTLKDISESINIELNKKKEKWYETYKILYNDKFEEYENCISVKLNKKLLFKYRIEMEEICEMIESMYDDLYCVFSSQSIAQIDIYIDVSKIKFSEKQLLFITEENSVEIYIEECVQPILEKITLFGIKGIDSIYFTKDDITDEWFIETDGTNFKRLMGHPIVDSSRILSNNVWDIYETLGIEAAREFLVTEFESIMEGINSCHTKLLVEKMTFTGTINSISRYTLRKDSSGVLSKCSFEESTDIMIKAGFAGETEKVKGISASIICGKRGDIGSGFVDLKIDVEQLKNAIPIFKDEGVVI